MEQEIFTYKSSTLRQSDIELFDRGQWLNDQCINFFYEYLSNLADGNYVLLDPATVFIMLLEDDIDDLKASLHRIQFSSSSYIFCPINDNIDSDTPGRGSHWTLCVYAGELRKAYYYDSNGRAITNYQNALTITYKLSQLLNQQTPSLTQVPLKHLQNNSSDCGVYVLMITQAILSHRSNSLTPEQFLLTNHQDSITPQTAQSLRDDIKRIILSLKSS